VILEPFLIFCRDKARFVVSQLEKNPARVVQHRFEANVLDKAIQDDYTIQNYLKGLRILNVEEESNRH
jgi:hypothetical protein